MTAAFVIVVSLALLPQLIFTFAYWKFIPQWRNNPYGRLSQLGAWCHIVLLSLYLVLAIFGKHLNVFFSQVVLISAFIPLIIFGISQLYLLRIAIDSSRKEEEEKSK